MKRILFLLLFVSLAILSSCVKEHEKPQGDAVRTTIVYIVADNNLSTEAHMNINNIIRAYPNTHNNLIVYADISGTPPQLLELEYRDGEPVATLVKEYEEGNSVDEQVMSSRISEIQSLYPAPNYGLVLWSHATGWYPQGAEYDVYTHAHYRTSGLEAAPFDMPKTKTFGDDDGEKIDIDVLARILPKNFEFILFDCCLMACAETAYDLRENTKNIIFSPAEIISTGFPYHNVTDILVNDNIDYGELCREYFEYYNSLTNLDRSATITHITTEHMAELQKITKEIVTKNQDKIAMIDLNNVQKMGRRHITTGYAYVDAASYIRQIATPEEYVQFRLAMEDVVKLVYNTPYYFCSDAGASYYGGFEIKENSGMTLYMPQALLTNGNIAHQETAWSID